jgi:hypothetical protein
MITQVHSSSSCRIRVQSVALHSSTLLKRIALTCSHNVVCTCCGASQVRDSWQKFLRQYITERRSLRVLFHLMDGRHGPVGQDIDIMTNMAQMPASARYVVVLTKVS